MHRWRLFFVHQGKLFDNGAESYSTSLATHLILPLTLPAEGLVLLVWCSHHADFVLPARFMDKCITKLKSEANLPCGMKYKYLATLGRFSVQCTQSLLYLVQILLS
jgi:hypothetical protein